jgi:SAM-dependent methyltransferase
MQYWDRVGATWKQERPDLLWRLYSDAVSRRVLDEWLPADRVDRLLKTDLFDEAVTDGLYPLLKRRARHVVGIDLSTTVLAQAAKGFSGDARTVGADVRSLPFVDNSFDVVVSTSTLDHFSSFDDVGRSLRELHRVLRPGGEMLLTLDNRANPVIALRNALPFAFLHRIGLVPYFVGATCGPRRLCRTLAEAGFKVHHIGAVLHCPRAAAVWWARLAQRYGTERGRQRFLRRLGGFERLSFWRTRFLTGHFLFVRAIKPCPIREATSSWSPPAEAA